MAPTGPAITLGLFLVRFCGAGRPPRGHRAQRSKSRHGGTAEIRLNVYPMVPTMAYHDGGGVV